MITNTLRFLLNKAGIINIIILRLVIIIIIFNAIIDISTRLLLSLFVVVGWSVGWLVGFSLGFKPIELVEKYSGGGGVYDVVMVKNKMSNIRLNIECSRIFVLRGIFLLLIRNCGRGKIFLVFEFFEFISFYFFGSIWPVCILRIYSFRLELF